jgi:hypothetical protein
VWAWAWACVCVRVHAMRHITGRNVLDKRVFQHPNLFRLGAHDVESLPKAVESCQEVVSRFGLQGCKPPKASPTLLQ